MWGPSEYTDGGVQTNKQASGRVSLFVRFGAVFVRVVARLSLVPCSLLDVLHSRGQTEQWQLHNPDPNSGHHPTTHTPLSHRPSQATSALNAPTTSMVPAAGEPKGKAANSAGNDNAGPPQGVPVPRCLPPQECLGKTEGAANGPKTLRSGVRVLVWGQRCLPLSCHAEHRHASLTWAQAPAVSRMPQR